MAKKRKPQSTDPELAAAPATEIETPSLKQDEAQAASQEIMSQETASQEIASQVHASDESGVTVEAAEAGQNEAEDELQNEESEGGEEPDSKARPRPPAKLERLQKILAQAGVASRRKAEEMIEQGRVRVNGKIVTELGTKADSGRDHIRVDGKLLQGAERLRYYVLNKPRGFVTTVKDPEGRPTVMQFFEKMKERLYPVGRLDYMSEGLLVVTNDGELANRLTKAASGVEKTYLVKVAGQPTEDELDALRGGVSIERGKPGSPQVRTSPARIRQVRQGDNPWFEVVLIEGRNRELRKMFEEVGHFVEKIRRIGYGPLVLDQEPGNLRELEPEELDLLRKAAEGKLRTPKSKEIRRRNAMDSQLPTIEPRRSRPPASQPTSQRSAPAGDYRPKKSFENDRTTRPFRPTGDRPASPSSEEFRPAADRTADRRTDVPRRPGTPGPARFDGRPTGRPSARPAWQKNGNAPVRFAAATGDSRPPAGKPYGDRPADAQPRGDKATGKTFRDRPSRPSSDKPAKPFAEKPRTFGDKPAGRSFGAKPAGKSFADKPVRNGSKPGSSDRSDYKRPALSTRADDDYSDLEPRKPVKIFIEPIQREERSSRPGAPRPVSDRPYSARPSAPRSYSGRPATDRSSAPRSFSDRPRTNRPEPADRTSSDRPSYDGPGSSRPRSDRTGSSRPSRDESGLERRFTTSSGKPRAGGARPSSKPGRSYGAGAGRRSGPSTGARSDSRPSFGAKRSYDGKPGASSRPSFGQVRPSLRRDDGSSSAPSSRTPRSSTPRTMGASDYHPASAKPNPNSASRSERKAGTGWKPKTRYGGSGKPASGARAKSGSFSKSSTKSKPGGKKRG
jgi:23S rRNA pseudouridine2605 synthase